MSLSLWATGARCYAEMMGEKSEYSMRRKALVAVASHDEAQQVVKLLRGKGLEMVFAENAVQAASLYRKEKPILAIFDEGLPEGGLGALEMIASSVSMITQPIVLRDSMFNPELQRIVCGRRAIAVRKPLVADEFLYAVRRVLKEEFKDSLEISDPVTGLYTLQSALLLGEQQAKLSARTKKPLTLLKIKVADMGKIVYEHGLKEADRALAETAKVILSSFRRSDIKARLRPDEFLVVILENVEGSNELIIERFRKKIEDLNQGAIIPFKIYVTMTVRTFPSEQLRSFAHLLRCVDYVTKTERYGAAGKRFTGGDAREVPVGDSHAFCKQATPSAAEVADLASFPAATLKAFRVLREVNAGMRDLEEFISTDAPLTGRVLEIASSPFFSGGRVIDSLPHAVSAMGLEGVRAVIISAFLYDICRSAVPEEKKLWEHSMGVAVVSSLLSKKIGTTQETRAFVAGLFHDMGKLAMRSAYPDAYPALIASVERSEASFCEAENTMFGLAHTAVGGALAQKQGLPGLYRTIMEHHHDSQAPEGLTEEERRLLDIVKAADEVAFFAGIGLKRSIDVDQLCCLGTYVTDDSLQEFLWEVDGKFAEYKEIVGV